MSKQKKFKKSLEEREIEILGFSEKYKYYIFEHTG